MTNKNQVYRCEVCGNMTEVVHSGADALVCCGQPMKLLVEKTKDEGNEKHVPVVENLGDGKYKIKVGEVLHPMEEKHFIEWIEVVCDLGVFRYDLSPNNKPEIEIYLGNVKDFVVREYCNVHGLWKK